MMCDEQVGHGANTGNVSVDYTFEACVFGTDQVRSGEGEVDILGTFKVEVVVLSCSRVDGRGSRDLGDGSGTCLSVVGHDDPERVLGNMHVLGSCTQTLSDLMGLRSLNVVVHVRFLERYMVFFGHRYLTFCYPGLRRRSLYT